MAAPALPLWATGREAVEDTGTVVWRQVLLLGFDTAAYARQEGIRDVDALGPKMFSRQSPNKSGLFCVLHFLFGVLDPAYTQVRVYEYLLGCACVRAAWGGGEGGATARQPV
jgi:hypothetical protein